MSKSQGLLGSLAAIAVFTAFNAVPGVLRGADAPAGGSMKPGRVCLRIQLGLKDQDETRWDGQIRVSPGSVAKLEIWRKGPNDAIDGDSWRFLTRAAPRFLGAKKKAQTQPSENGVIATLDGLSENAEINITTKQGDFSFKLSEVPYGKRLMRLDGAADVIRIPVSYQLTSDATEEDYPSAAVAPDGTAYVAYTAFTHGKDFAKRQPYGDAEPDISNLDQPTGGDRVFVIRMSQGQWSAPMPVTKGGEDLYKTAIAVDGSGRPWVFWSGQQEGNFDLYASSLRDGVWTAPIRLTTDPGTDINPAAACDSKGHVWVVWQGFRNGTMKILAVSLTVRQQGDAFSPEMVVADEPGNCWDPAIATSRSGDIAVAWDTYTRGNYDVSLRVAKGGEQFGPVVLVAASLAQEVHASLAYDSTGRLWAAWERGPEKWGKDFGALAKGKGAPLYGGGPRTVAVKCFEGDQAFQTAGDLDEALRSGPAAAPRPAAKQGKKGKGGAKAKTAPQRQAGEERRTNDANPLSYPRLVADSSGRVWLAYRARAPHFWCNVGTAWFEYLTCCEGGQWLRPIYVHNSDNILDNRPALVALNDGSLLMVGSSDGRQKVSGYPAAQQKEPRQGAKGEAVNNDIYASHFGLPGAAQASQLAPIAAEVPAAVGSAEKDAVARCRSYRLEIGGKSLRLQRGEFHRHTELSTDGAGDGALTDMYRYGLDAVGFDWIGCGDHDNNNGREYPWWITQKTADAFTAGQVFVPMYSYERSVTYPDGHRNAIFAHRGVRTLLRYGKPGTGSDNQKPPHTPDTQLLYKYLAKYDGVCASHTSATNMGTDWRDNDPKVEPVVEIYQGCRQNYEEPGAPRAPAESDAIGGWRPNGFVWNALAKGYRLGFQSSSDHVSTHISYCSIWAEQPTRVAMLDALKQRHVFGATDNIIADVRCGEHMLGDEFTMSGKPSIKVKLIGTGKFKQVDVVRSNAYVYSTKPGKREVEFTWTDMSPRPGTSYYYVRGEQEDGELVWVSPMWITLK